MAQAAGNDRSPWTLRAVEKLRELWKDGVPPEIISQTLGRPEAEVRAKAAEFGLSQHVGLNR
jgi:hypothetical protein